MLDYAARYKGRHALLLLFFLPSVGVNYY